MIEPEWFWGLGCLLLVAWLIFSEESEQWTVRLDTVPSVVA